MNFSQNVDIPIFFLRMVNQFQDEIAHWREKLNDDRPTQK